MAASVLIALGCDRPAQAEMAKPDAAALKPPIIVDSILSSGEALRRFQADMPRVSVLGGAAPSRDVLVERFMTALERGDSAALSELHISRAEYAFLYYPTSTYSRKPYELPPDIAWLLSEQNSLKGLTRVTRRLGGKNLELSSYACGPPATEGENRFWRSCHVSYIDPATGAPVTKRLFGVIMQHGARYKFLSYSNDF